MSKEKAFDLKDQVSGKKPEIVDSLEPDENGCVVKKGKLVEYRGDYTHAVISEGVRVIPKDVLRKIQGSCHLPESLEKIEWQTSF